MSRLRALASLILYGGDSGAVEPGSLALGVVAGFVVAALIWHPH